MKALGIVIGLVSAAVAGSAVAEDTTAGCYDAIVYGRAVRQISAGMGTCADCVVLRWPFFVDIEVKRVIEGDVHQGVLTVLALQHGTYKAKSWNWWLRRNSAGGFNVVSRGEDKGLQRCPDGTASVRPFVVPPEGQTLQEMHDRLDHEGN